MIEGFKTRHYRYKGANPGNEKKVFWIAIIIAALIIAAISYLF